MRQLVLVLIILGQMFSESVESSAYLIADSADFTAHDVQVGLLTHLADLLLAMRASRHGRLLAAHVAALHRRRQRFGLFTRNVSVKLEESHQRDVCRKCLHAVVRNSGLGATLGALDLPSGIVLQTLQARVRAEGVLTWQQFRVSIPVQTDGARKQLVELAPRRSHG